MKKSMKGSECLELQIKKSVESDGLLKDKEGQQWDYITVNAMQERYPNGGYLILADIREGKESDICGYLHDELQKAVLYPYVAKLKRCQKCVGYIQVDSEENADAFVRIVKTDKKKKFLFWLIPLLLISLLLGGIYYMNQRETPPNLDENAISYHVDGMKNRDPNQIAIPVFTVFETKAADMKVKSNMANPEGNPAYFEYHVQLKDTKEEIYVSKLIEPGMAVPGFTIGKKLEPGEYEITVTVKCYDLNDHTKEMNGGAMDSKLVVKGE